jgi:uncharacterized protein (UPF0332 family)
MKQHKDILAKNCLDKSEQAIKNAELNVENDFLTGAHNRAYYAIFYLVLALGYLDEFVTSKHYQLMGWFNKKYIYELKEFDPICTKIYGTLIRHRQTYDYDMSQTPTKENVIKDIQDAKLFIEKVQPYVLKRFEELIKQK